MLTVAQNKLQRTTPETQGIASSAILQFVTAAEQSIHELHSFMLMRHGAVVAEGWWTPYAADRLHMLFSLSKSFTSSAIGMAVEEGLLSVEDKVVSFFPDEAPAQVSEHLADMRIKHLLSMSTGHGEDTMPPMRQREDGNWIKAFFDVPVTYEPGTDFLYNTGATYMLSAILQKLTGQMLLDYLQPRLLEPLGIEDAWWEVSPQGINTGGFGLNVKTEDIARFGQMYLQKGVWNGERLLTESWIDEATKRQISNGTSDASDWEQGYGYQFWRCRHNAYRGDGAFGQYCIVMPDQEAVLAITSGVSDMQAVLNLVWDILLPAMQATPLPSNVADQKALAEKLSSLAIQPPQGQAEPPSAATVTGKRYLAESNPLNIEAVTLDFAESGFTLAIGVPNDEQRLTGGYGAWRECPTWLFGSAEDVAVSGVWTANDTFAVTVRRFLTPFVHTLSFKFDDDQMQIVTDVNVSFEPLHHEIAAHRA